VEEVGKNYEDLRGSRCWGWKIELNTSRMRVHRHANPLCLRVPREVFMGKEEVVYWNPFLYTLPQSCGRCLRKTTNSFGNTEYSDVKVGSTMT
jgi:hypothetical protein